MGCGLIIDIVMFALTVKEICALDITIKEIATESRYVEIDRFLTFSKLLLGTVVLWIVEIIVGVLGTNNPEHDYKVWRTTLVRTFYGIFVFVIFVFQRNVLGRIFEAYKNTVVHPTREDYPLANSS